MYIKTMHQYDLIMNPHPFFNGLCTDHLRTLALMAHRIQFRKGQFIFREGRESSDNGNNVFMHGYILRGRQLALCTFCQRLVVLCLDR